MNNVHFTHAPVFSVLDSKMLVVSIRTIQKEEKKRRKTLYRTPAQNEATAQNVSTGTSRLERQTVQTEPQSDCSVMRGCLCVCVHMCECVCVCVCVRAYACAVEVKYGNVFL